VVTEQYTHAEHLQKKTEVKTRKVCCPETVWVLTECEPAGEDLLFCKISVVQEEMLTDPCGCCHGALEVNFNTEVIGVAHIGWLSRDTKTNKGRHVEYGRSVEDLIGVFSIEKFIQLWDNESCGTVQVDWLPCI
jgi:hypothetical protein